MKEKNQPRSDVTTYQMVQISGNMSFCLPEPAKDKCTNKLALPMSSTKEKHVSIGSPESERSELVEKISQTDLLSVIFKGIVKIILVNPLAELSLSDANLDEYVSRLTLDGTLLFADHRFDSDHGLNANLP